MTWREYEKILENYDGIRNPRLFYDRGVLEIEPTSAQHEKPKDILGVLIEMLSDHVDMDVLSIGQSTLKRKNSRRGFEPDDSYYFNQKAGVMRGVDRVDLQIHPAPDLIIEIDITSPSTDKLALFAAVDIAEVWIFKEQQLKFLQLTKNIYQEASESIALPNVSSDVLTDFVNSSREMSRPEWRKKVREWMRENLSR